MKKNLKNKLKLKKLTISELTKQEMNKIFAGSTDSPCPGSGTSYPQYCVTDGCPTSYPQNCSDNA